MGLGVTVTPDVPTEVDNEATRQSDGGGVKAALCSSTGCTRLMSLRVQSTVAVKRITADAGGCRCGPDVEADRAAPFPPALDVNNDHRPPI